MRKLVEQGYEVYLPMLAKWERKKGAWHKTEDVMFPRYSFVRCVRPGQSIAPIRSTPGVSGLVTFGTTHATLGETAVEAIRAIVEQGANTLQTQAAPFRVGENVAVADGPLKGLAGIVSEIAQERVVVMLTLLGCEKPVAIAANHLALA